MTGGLTLRFFNKSKKEEQYDDYIDDDYLDNDYVDEDYYEENDEENFMHNHPDNKKSKKSKKNVKKSTLNNLQSFHEEEYGENIDYEDYYSDTNEVHESTNKIDKKSVCLLVFAFFYCIFLIIGVMGTTFAEGYKPQMVTPKIKSERVVYYQVQKQIDELEEMESFKGVSELKEVMKAGNYQSRVPRLKEALKNVNSKIDDMNTAAYKVDQDDYVNSELMGMSTDLLTSMKDTLTLAIKYYESASGYSSTTDALKSSQTDLLNQYQVYNNKLANYKTRLEQIKYYDLKLEE